MPSDDPYNAWLQQKQSVAFPAGFSEAVVGRVLESKQTRRRRWPQSNLIRWPHLVSLRALLQSAAIASALVAGALRLILLVQLALSL